MSIRIEGYTAKYRADVIACIARNYDSLQGVDLQVVDRWFSPCLEYHWQDDILADFPHKYGSVLLDDDTVVGFCGNIYSKRYAEDTGEAYIFLRPTTWAIDEKYRIYLFKILKEQFQVADVIGDFAPRESVEEALVKLYKFYYCDKVIYKFRAIPHFFFNKLRCQFVLDAKMFNDTVLQTELLDNQRYGVKAVRFWDFSQECVIFYQLVGKVSRRKIMVLKVTNGEMLAKHAHEIIWKLMTHEGAYHRLKCDSRFFAGHKVNFPYYSESSAERLVLNKKRGLNPQLDFLYSDICMLEE